MAVKCSIKFNDIPGNSHISQIVAGYKMLDESGVIKIKKAEPCSDFRSSGKYEHNGIVEVDLNGIKLAYDMADGYQSIHRKDVFDFQLDNLDFYFKRSFYPEFHKEMKNRDKVKPLGLNYLCTCKKNPYDRFFLKTGNGILNESRRFLINIRSQKANQYLYNDFESNGIRYDKYNLLFLARIWDYTKTNAESIQKTYPYFSLNEAQAEADRWVNSLESATKSRIEYIRVLKECFGNRVTAGISRDKFSEKICPELIIPDEITERRHYIEMIKKNYICITSEGLHHSIGWKFAEYVAAGKSIITEPLIYEVPYGFEEGKNYLTYNDCDSLQKQCNYLLENPSAVHTMEEINRQYYKEHLRPDMLILDSLKTAGIL